MNGVLTLASEGCIPGHIQEKRARRRPGPCRLQKQHKNTPQKQSPMINKTSY